MSSSTEYNLSGKTILITGASSGIGRSTALELARTSPSLKLILTALGDDVAVLVKQLDVSRKADIDAFWQELEKEEGFKDVGVLVNNARFISGVERPPDVPREVIESVYKTNVMGVIHMTQAALAVFRKRLEGGKGDIVMLGSIARRQAYVGGTIYCSSKAAIQAFGESLRKEVVDTRIRIMTVDPGQAPIEFNDIRHRGDREKADAVYAINVFAVGRRENVVVMDTLLYPSH
ncbi:NAD(P)-binding protein [Bimuria novae-zelandiae CBS 107.79]|uniref:NAD(P)-binding protein n=1 Tax=Bimuria novae-zelandiae CBS 107.79 TaxID=1447943 RepID=A0A6A5UVH8_9PLEO|nr:NAD(P)-binding protein [Bimuria novae-zelandiae CBS 107.79]